MRSTAVREQPGPILRAGLQCWLERKELNLTMRAPGGTGNAQARPAGLETLRFSTANPSRTQVCSVPARRWK